MSPRLLEKVLYFASYVVIDPGNTNLKKYAAPHRKGVYCDMREAYEDDVPTPAWAPRPSRSCWQSMDLEALCEELQG